MRSSRAAALRESALRGSHASPHGRSRHPGPDRPGDAALNALIALRDDALIRSAQPQPRGSCLRPTPRPCGPSLAAVPTGTQPLRVGRDPTRAPQQHGASVAAGRRRKPPGHARPSCLRQARLRPAAKLVRLVELDRLIRERKADWECDRWPWSQRRVSAEQRRGPLFTGCTPGWTRSVDVGPAPPASAGPPPAAPIFRYWTRPQPADTSGQGALYGSGCLHHWPCMIARRSPSKSARRSRRPSTVAVSEHKPRCIAGGVHRSPANPGSFPGIPCQASTIRCGAWARRIAFKETQQHAHQTPPASRTSLTSSFVTTRCAGNGRKPAVREVVDSTSPLA